MAVSVSYPGVYIQEFAPGAPIAGVGTSTGAFIGVAEAGPINTPTLISSFDAFKEMFDEKPMDGYHLWYAVRGFYENGGQLCYIVRASSGQAESATLDDSRTTGAQTALVATAREIGDLSPDISVTVTHTSLGSAAAFRPEATVQQANGNTIEVTDANDAAQFRVGDRIEIDDTTNQDQGTISAIAGTILTLETALGNSYAGGTVQLVDLAAGDTVLRLDSGGANVHPGSVLAISQNGTNDTAVVKAVQAERISPTLTTYRVTLEDGSALANGYDRDPTAAAISVATQEFTLQAAQGTESESRPNLSMSRSHPRYVGAVMAAEPMALVTIGEPDVPSNAALPERRPATGTETLTGGVDADPAALTLADFQAALDALRDVDDVNFIAIPDGTDAAVQMALLSHCEDMYDRFAIFDPPPGLPPTGAGSIGDRVALLRSDNGFGALYYPWIRVPHPDGGVITVPPSGHVAGIYARADTQRGVHKAPANFTINGSLGIVQDMNDDLQGVLNLNNINVLRVFPGQARPVVWGARTTTPPAMTTWQYVNIRRLFLFLEESIEEGIRWAVFEPNNLQLWQKLRRTITEFLNRVWRDGALFGATPEEAFYVRIDEALNPPSERALGRLTIEIGVAPVYPAEFIIVRIGIWQGGSDVDEG